MLKSFWFYLCALLLSSVSVTVDKDFMVRSNAPWMHHRSFSMYRLMSLHFDFILICWNLQVFICYYLLVISLNHFNNWMLRAWYSVFRKILTTKIHIFVQFRTFVLPESLSRPSIIVHLSWNILTEQKLKWNQIRKSVVIPSSSLLYLNLFWIFSLFICVCQHRGQSLNTEKVQINNTTQSHLFIQSTVRCQSFWERDGTDEEVCQLFMYNI